MDAFDALVASLQYPMVVVTAAADGERAGCLVGFTTQCSIEPARFLVCLSKKNRTFRVAQHARTLAVHFLSSADDELARLFGEQTGDEVDKFAQCEWNAGPDGVPIVTGGRGWICGPVLDRVDLGDHVGFVLDVGDAAAPGAGEEQLGFQHVTDLQAGHEA